MLTLTRGTPTCAISGWFKSHPFSPLSFRADAIRATLARARSMARGSAAPDNPGSQAQGGMLEHGEHDRGAARWRPGTLCYPRYIFGRSRIRQETAGLTVCNDFCNNIPYSAYLEAFGQI
jgi:hypothetical protein